MRHCPHCHHPTIPAWHAHLGSLFSKPIICPNCHSTLVRVIGPAEAVSTIPFLAVAVFLGYESDLSFPPAVIWFLSGGAALAGMCLWSHFIRYKVKPTSPTLSGMKEVPSDGNVSH
jgi:hypothetical protein